jgi:hypothetical protein
MKSVNFAVFALVLLATSAVNGLPKKDDGDKKEKKENEEMNDDTVDLLNYQFIGQVPQNAFKTKIIGTLCYDCLKRPVNCLYKCSTGGGTGGKGGSTPI